MKNINLHMVLVGSNPLPAYITCKYLSIQGRNTEELEYLPNPDMYMFVFSNDTFEYYINLLDVLNLDRYSEKVRECNLYDEQTNASYIEKYIKEKFNQTAEENVIESIILNNTGGTKPMAVYSTQVVKEFCINKNIKELEIYVDPLEDKLKINSICKNFNLNNSNKTWPRNSNLTKYFDLEIENILKLHGFTLMKSKNWEDDGYFNSKEYVIDFVNLILNKKENDYFKLAEYLQDIKIYYSSRKNKNKVLGLSLDNEDNEDINLCFDLEKANKLKESIDLYKYNEFGDLQWLKQKCIDFDLENLTNKKAGKFLDMITGKWLEEYVYVAISEAIGKIKVRDYKSKFKIYWSLEAKPELSDKNFEIDVVVLKGYKLYGFTITTYDRENEAKLKIFELLHRAEQIGGEHSRVCVVSLLQEDSKIREDILSFNAEKYKNTAIITKDVILDYDNLVKSIINILNDRGI